MPTYSFKNKKTKKCFDLFMSMRERERYLKDNPNVVQELTPTTIVREVDGAKRVAGGFTDLLKTIKKGSPRSTVRVR